MSLAHLGSECTPWTLIKAYWQSKNRWPAYVFFGILILFTMSIVLLDVVFNYWYNYFYDALQAYNRSAIFKLIIFFTFLAAIYITIAVYRYYLSQLFNVRWRTWLTQELIGRWLKNRGYYYLENFDDKTDNPDQRIQEDIAALVTYSIDLSLGLISSITTFLAFIYILWELSGDMVIPLGSWGEFHFYGYLVWVCIIYAFAGTYYTMKIGKPLINLNFEQQKREATMRFAAVDLRTHAEHIALYQGEKYENSLLLRLYRRVVQNWYLLISRQKLLLWFTAGYNQTALILPLVFALPNYLDRIFLLGGLMQSVSAYGKVQDSLSYIVQSYTNIAQWQAVSKRLTTFINHLSENDKQATTASAYSIEQTEELNFKIKNLTLKNPDNKTLLKNISIDFKPHENCLIQGKSGIGKSTLIRTMAGIWPYAEGEIFLPKNANFMFLSQRPFIPMGKLIDAICFPSKPSSLGEIKKIMRSCDIEHLIPNLQNRSNWSEKLSPGEQQRIAFARVLLEKPSWIFMDESTSMVDIVTEQKLYETLKQKLPDTTIISIGHRESLKKFHSRVINLEKYLIN